MPKNENREYRNMTLEVVRDENEENEGMNVSGYASTFDDPYILFENEDLIYREQVDKNAFDSTDMTDVIMQYDHAGRVFARISNGTLDVSTDDVGLKIDADLSGTEIGRQLYEEIRGGYINKMSFGFTVEADDESRSETADGRVDILRTIRKVSRLYDVSAVSIPANDGTSISVSTRSRIDGAIEDIRTERSEAEKMALERKRTEIKAKAMTKGKKSND